MNDEPAAGASGVDAGATPTEAVPAPSPGRWSRDGVGRQLNLAAKASRGFLEQLLAEAGASFGVWSILAMLQTGGPSIQRELAARLSIEGPTLTRHLAQMEARGLVTRSRSTTDRRAARVELTPEGEALYERLTGVALECYAHVLDGFSPEETAQLVSMLVRIQHNARSAAARRGASR